MIPQGSDDNEAGPDPGFCPDSDPVCLVIRPRRRKWQPCVAVPATNIFREKGSGRRLVVSVQASTPPPHLTRRIIHESIRYHWKADLFTTFIWPSLDKVRSKIFRSGRLSHLRLLILLVRGFLDVFHQRLSVCFTLLVKPNYVYQAVTSLCC